MEWNHANNITLSVYRKSQKLTNTQKKTLIKKCKNTCYYCGGKYASYLYCTNDTFIMCKLCYIITHVDFYLHNNEIVLLYSSMNQIDIIRKTVDYIMEHNTIPLFKNIDKTVKKPQLSIIEYMAVKEDLCDNNYKIFFTNNLNMSFISKLLDNTIYSFSDEDNKMDILDIKNHDDELTNMEIHSLTQKQINVVNKIFNKTEYIEDMMEDVINKHLCDIYNQQILIDNTDIYNKIEKKII
jgi:hypothetical protein